MQIQEKYFKNSKKTIEKSEKKKQRPVSGRETSIFGNSVKALIDFRLKRRKVIRGRRCCVLRKSAEWLSFIRLN